MLEKANPKSNRFVMDWADLKQVVLAAIGNDGENFEKLIPLAHNRSCIQKYCKTPEVRWAGYSAGQLERWLIEGFQTEAIQGLSEFIPPIRDKRKFMFSEEGDEFHFDIAAGGGDNFMSRFTTREQIPGLALEIGMGFRGGTSAEILNAYQVWLCRIAFSLDAAGIDTEITLRNRTQGIFQRNTGQYDTLIRVKKENEVSDFVSWSAMLSPGGFRGLVFAAKSIHASARGYSVSPDMGSSIGPGWIVKFVPETRTMVFDCPHSPYGTFPEEDMTRQLREQLKLASNYRK